MANYASLRGPVGMNRVFIAIVGRDHAGKTARRTEAGPDLRQQWPIARSGFGRQASG